MSFHYKTALILAAGLIVFSCSSDDDDEATTTAAAGGTTTDSVTSADSLDDLNISSAFSLALPSALGGDSSSSLALAPSTKKSMEACEVGRITEEGIRSLATVANMFCHLEVEADTLQFGEKYSITFAGMSENDEDAGQEMAIWVDDSVEGQLTVNFCQGGSLSEKIVITGTKEVGEDSASKGTVLQHGSEGQQSWSRSITFDVGHTTTGVNFISAKDIYSNASNSEEFKRMLVLNLVDSAVVTDQPTKVLVSSSGTWQGSEFSHAGAALLDADYGQVIFSSAGTDPFNNEAYTWTHRGSFNSTGFIVPEADSASLQAGGSLRVADADVPKFLDSTFAIDDFATTDWDCSGTTAVEIDMSGANGAAHDACEVNMNNDEEGVNCWGSEYEQSDEDHEIDESAQKEHDEFDSVDEVHDDEDEEEAAE